LLKLTITMCQLTLLQPDYHNMPTDTTATWLSQSAKWHFCKLTITICQHTTATWLSQSANWHYSNLTITICQLTLLQPDYLVPLKTHKEVILKPCFRDAWSCGNIHFIKQTFLCGETIPLITIEGLIILILLQTLSSCIWLLDPKIITRN
jgi:hypothetical protein